MDLIAQSPDATHASAFRAAEYVRMSTEHQQYSTHNQADKIREYATRCGEVKLGNCPFCSMPYHFRILRGV